MHCLLFVVGLLFPRVVLVSLLLLTTYLDRAYGGLLVPSLGTIFLPYTCLWYAAVEVSLQGQWGLLQQLLLLLAVLFDLTSALGTRRRYRVVAIDED